jgi:hypothetical protein
MKLSEGVLTPAYGRDYRTKDEVIKAFESGKDFRFNYIGRTTNCSIEDMEYGEPIKFRYSKGRRTFIYDPT